MKRNTVILVGPPGAGKSTVGRRLAENLPGWCFYAATGDMVRNLMGQDSELAEKVRGFTREGKLTPDPIICDMLQDYLDYMTTSKVYCPSHQFLILDGSPRTLAQAEEMKHTLAFVEVYHCRLSDQLASDRILVTRAAELEAQVKPKRLDDTPAAVAKRLHEYHLLTEPTLDFYRQEGVPITHFDMSRTKSEVHSAMENHFRTFTLDRSV